MHGDDFIKRNIRQSKVSPIKGKRISPERIKRDGSSNPRLVKSMAANQHQEPKHHYVQDSESYLPDISPVR